MAVDHVPARRLSSPCSPVATAAAGTPSAAERLPRPPPSWAAPSGAAAEGWHELHSLLLALCPRPWPERSELVSPRSHGRRGPGREGRSWPPGAQRSSGVTMRGASGTTSTGWTVFETPSTPGSLPYFRSIMSGPDPVLTSVSGRVVPVMLVRERSAAGERPAAVEDPRNVAGAIAIRSGRKRLLAWGDDAPAAGLASTRRSAWRRLRRRCRRVSP